MPYFEYVHAVSLIHGIYAGDLVGEDKFEDVYSQFCAWVKKQVHRFSQASGVTYYPGNE